MVTHSRPLRVLHVDDEPGFADMVATHLERENDRFDVETATSASGGLERLAETEPDCIVSDYDMPGRDGIDLLEAIRDDYPDLPFILFTGKGSEEVASDAISAGATDYLQKRSGTDQYELLANRIRNAVEQYRAQQAAAETERRLQTIADHANDVLWQFSADWTELLFINAAYEDIWGRPTDELRADPQSFLKGVHPDSRSMVEDEMEQLSAGNSIDIEYRVNADEDSDRWVWVQGEPVFDDDGEVASVVGFARDITGRKERERAIERLQQRTQALMHTATKEETAQVAVETAHEVVGAQLSGVHLVGPDQQTLEPAGYVDTVRAELGELPTYDRTATDDPAARIVWEVFESGDPLVIDDTREYGRLAEVTPARSGIVHPLNEHGVFIVSATEPNAFDDTDRTLIEIVATSLTGAFERVERERTVERRNERLDQFASVVSHDLRNPLNVAQGRLELAREECDSAHLDEAVGAIDRSLSLVEDLLMLARKGKEVSDPEAVELGDLIDGCWQTVETADATLVCETERLIQADSSRLMELLENLFRNAVEHGGDDVTVTVGELAERAGFYVADDGPGIPADERDAVFEAGYSTTDDGTGFGLQIVKGIVEAHGWEITVTDSEAGGARFEITGIEQPA